MHGSFTRETSRTTAATVGSDANAGGRHARSARSRHCAGHLAASARGVSNPGPSPHAGAFTHRRRPRLRGTVHPAPVVPVKRPATARYGSRAASRVNVARENSPPSHCFAIHDGGSPVVLDDERRAHLTGPGVRVSANGSAGAGPRSLARSRAACCARCERRRLPRRNRRPLAPGATLRSGSRPPTAPTRPACPRPRGCARVSGVVIQLSAGRPSRSSTEPGDTDRPRPRARGAARSFRLRVSHRPKRGAGSSSTFATRTGGRRSPSARAAAFEELRRPSSSSWGSTSASSSRGSRTASTTPRPCRRTSSCCRASAEVLVDWCRGGRSNRGTSVHVPARTEACSSGGR